MKGVDSFAQKTQPMLQNPDRLILQTKSQLQISPSIPQRNSYIPRPSTTDSPILCHQTNKYTWPLNQFQNKHRHHLHPHIPNPPVPIRQLSFISSDAQRDYPEPVADWRSASKQGSSRDSRGFVPPSYTESACSRSPRHRSTGSVDTSWLYWTTG